MEVGRMGWRLYGRIVLANTRAVKYIVFFFKDFSNYAHMMVIYSRVSMVVADCLSYILRQDI